jgi:hypothetical protein
MEAACSSGMSMNYYQITWNIISEDITLNTVICHCFNLLAFNSVLNEVQKSIPVWGPW